MPGPRTPARRATASHRPAGLRWQVRRRAARCSSRKAVPAARLACGESTPTQFHLSTNHSCIERYAQTCPVAERRRNPNDRRLHALYLTAAGKKLMRKLSELARQHELRLTAALDPEQRGALRTLLAAVAQQQGLTPHVHPGYRTLPRSASAIRVGPAPTAKPTG